MIDLLLDILLSPLMIFCYLVIMAALLGITIAIVVDMIVSHLDELDDS